VLHQPSKRRQDAVCSVYIPES